MRFPTQSSNNPYTSADPCENCGSRSCSRFVRCEGCNVKGCDDCLILEEEPQAEDETGYRDSYCICGECSNRPAPKAVVNEREWDDAEVTF